MTTSEEFAAFWSVYPRHVAKLAAEKAFAQARKRGVSFQQIVEGVQRYIHGKPSYADWAHPATWLRGGRWMDEYAAQQTLLAKRHWSDECAELHGGTCLKRWDHEMLKQDTA